MSLKQISETPETAREGQKMLEDRQKTMNKLAIAHLSFISNYFKCK